MQHNLTLSTGREIVMRNATAAYPDKAILLFPKSLPECQFAITMLQLSIMASLMILKYQREDKDGNFKEIDNKVQPKTYKDIENFWENFSPKEKEEIMMYIEPIQDGKDPNSINEVDENVNENIEENELAGK